MPFNDRAIVLLTLLLFASPLWAGEAMPLKPGPKDKCPVCGMYVAKYPDWVAALTLRDGTRVFFDGVKDMLKYYFNMAKYAPGKTAADIQVIYVTDYYRLEPIDGRMAFYVGGSDVYGPMGKELIPFQSEKAANEFMSDHVGQSLLKFQDISVDTLKGLD